MDGTDPGASRSRERERIDLLKQDFMRVASHELRTPLTVIGSTLQVFEQRWDTLDPDQRDDLVRRMRANATAMEQILDRLADAARWESGLLTPEPSSFSVTDVVRGVLHRMAPTLDGREILTVLDEAEVSADRVLVDRVIENLLTNAARHGGPRIRLSVEHLAGSAVRVGVDDDGPGLPAVVIDELGEPLVGGSDTRPGGLQLGLHLIRQVLESHGTRLQLGTAPDWSTSLSFVLPAA